MCNALSTNNWLELLFLLASGHNGPLPSQVMYKLLVESLSYCRNFVKMETKLNYLIPMLF